MSSSNRVITPKAPRPTASAFRSGFERSTVTSEPSAFTSSTADTAVDRMPLRSPEPWVPVAVAPATEMCGSEPVLCSA